MSFNKEVYMAYSIKVPSVKIAFTIKEYNILIDALNKNINNTKESNDDFAITTRDKLLRHGLPVITDEKEEIELRLYINETADIISQLIKFAKNYVDDVDYTNILLRNRNSNRKDNNVS
jgi:hypothetical protein